jgi:hypothetical protein
MYEDRIDEQKLINTLKGLLKGFLPSESLPMEKTVNRYLDIKFKNLSEVSNSENNVIFYFKDGKTKFFYNKNTKNLTYLTNDLLNVMVMFKLDEDTTEEILKRWFQSKFRLEVNYMYNES